MFSCVFFFFFSSRRRHTRLTCDWSSDVCSSDLEEVGVERIRERSQVQTALLVELLEGAGLEIVSPRDPARRGGTVVVRTPEAEAVHRELEAREIICDFRPEVGIRLGPHFFNTEGELRFAAAQLTQIVESGAFERHLDAARR